MKGMNSERDVESFHSRETNQTCNKTMNIQSDES